MDKGQASFNVLRVDHPHILVAEKDRAISTKMAGVFEVVTVANEKDTLTALCEPFPKAVLVSSELARGSAEKLCQSIKGSATTAHIPVILVAADFTEDLEIAGLSAGANDVISQSASEELITLRIDRLSDRLGAWYHRSSFLERVDRVLFKYLEFETFHVEELAKCLHMDRKTLYRRIKKDSMLTPQIYIRNLRVSRAGHLLKRGTMTISEVAFEVGFPEVSYFSKCFRSYFKKSPSEFVSENVHG